MTRKVMRSVAIAIAFGLIAAILIGGVPGLVAAFVVSGIVGVALA